MADPDSLPALTRMIAKAFGDRLSARDGTFTDMRADDVHFEAPYAPGGGLTLTGRQALVDYLPGVSDIFRIDELELTAKYDSGEDVSVIEFKAHGEGAKSGRPYRQRYINVITFRDGEIARYIDFWNPIIAMWTAGDDTISAELAGEA